MSSALDGGAWGAIARPVPLLDLHERLGATPGEFAGFVVPMDYGSVFEEHMAVRTSAGVFDLSHMTLIRARGPGAEELLELLVPRSLERGAEGVIVGPTAFLNEGGGIKDDVMIYELGPGDFLVVGNAINLEKDREWLVSNARSRSLDVNVEVLNGNYCLLALQGPSSAEIAERLSDGLSQLKRLTFEVGRSVGGFETLVTSRSGWTGEDGFEFVLKCSTARGLFEELRRAGARPCGIASRDTLRLEMGYVLYEQDIDESISPVEARYWAVFELGKVRRGECIGCDALLERLRRGAERVRVGVKLGRGEKLVPRRGSRILVESETVGVVTSGGYSPVLGRPIAMGYARASHALIGLEVEIEARGRRARGKIPDFPFVEARVKAPK
ncbi:MAG: glycine cleavage system aminomethyltransferase GcvT [Fervidicoccaceae archaeon]